MIIKTITLPVQGLSSVRANQEVSIIESDYPGFIILWANDGGHEDLSFERTSNMGNETQSYDVIFKIPTCGLSLESAEQHIHNRMTYMSKKLNDLLENTGINHELVVLTFGDSYIHHKYYNL